MCSRPFLTVHDCFSYPGLTPDEVVERARARARVAASASEGEAEGAQRGANHERYVFTHGRLLERVIDKMSLLTPPTRYHRSSARGGIATSSLVSGLRREYPKPWLTNAAQDPA